MAKTREEFEKEASEAATKLGQEYRDEQRAAAEDAREDEQFAPETEEEYAERIRLARQSGIFGDTDTTAGAGASLTDVPSSDNEGATVAVAEADAQAAEGDEEAAEASTDEARRQVDVEAGTTASAEEVDEAADDDTEDESDDSDDDDVDFGGLASDNAPDQGDRPVEDDENASA
jgi:hypothetical protein